MGRYLKRIVESQIERKMKSSGAVLIAGPKFCGKTTTATQFAKSIKKLSTESAINLARMEPRATLDGEKPRLIDEWQTVPQIWDEVRNYIDENSGFGQFILTGSSTPEDKTQIHHSGAGRITPVKMRPMSLYESLESNGMVSIGRLFENKDVNVLYENTEYNLRKTAFLLCRGGWPQSIVEDDEVALDITANYYEGLFSFENSDNDKFRNKNPEILKMLLRSYARNISTEASVSTIIQDIIQTNSRNTFDVKTYDDYMDALKDLFIIEDILAWNPNIRSKAAIRSTPTRHFVDTSIACAALGISPDDLMGDMESFGLFFEDMVVRDLTIYSSCLKGEVRHYRDSNGLECDAIIHLPDGTWAAVEVKLGGEKLINAGIANLNKLKSLVSKEPAFMMIITATGPAYRRPDGIYVVPINCLKD
ncbi:MAG: DUF4143 domain-containing protein [Bacteroidales bacterium]|nr:DUF4143 domain-containing protein [Bacteroidales bacterium]